MLDTREPPLQEDRCYGCGRDQSHITSYYTGCGECGHLFETADELLETDRVWWEGIDLPQPELTADQIATCPCCTHDL